MDIRCNISEPVTLAPMERKLIPTGLFIELPVGFEAQIRPLCAHPRPKAQREARAPLPGDADRPTVPGQEAVAAAAGAGHAQVLQQDGLCFHRGAPFRAGK